MELFKNFSIVMDIDGTICPVKGADEKYEDLIPFTDVIIKMNEYKKAGAKIILYTSRNVNTYRGNLGLINANTAKILLSWLDKWQIPYDEILYGKPWPGNNGFYVDDRAVRPDEFIKYGYDELIEICKESKNLK